MGTTPQTEELAVALVDPAIEAVIKGFIPAGKDGKDGAKGDAGAKGPKGDKGAKGDTGPAGGGAGIAPADQAKLDHITIASDLDIDTIDTNAKSAVAQVGALNLDGSGTTLMSAKDIELAQAQVVPTDPVLALKDNRMITVASTIAAFNNMSVKVMMEKGIITDISGITETGIYEGTDVANSPMTGPIMVMANKDSNGDFGFFLMGADGVLHTGGKAQLGKTFWTEIKAEAVAEGSIEVDASYSGRFVSPNMDTFTGQATHDLFNTKEHKVMFIDKAGNDWTTDKDPYAWYLRGGGELGHFSGASGHVGSKVMEGWVKHKNIVTIQYTDSTKKEFNVLKVEGDIQVGGSDHLVADGSVEMIPTYKPSKPNSIVTKEYADIPTGLFDFDYDVVVGTIATQAVDGKIGFDTVDPTAATKIYVGNKDRNGIDMKLFLGSIVGHDWLNIHDAVDLNTVIAFDATNTTVSGAGVVIDVSKVFSQGTLANGRAFIHWERNTNTDAMSILDVAEIADAGTYDGTDVIGAPVQGKIIIEAYMDSHGNLDLSCKGADMRRYEGGKSAAGVVHFGTVAPDHLSGTTAPADTLGHDGDIYFLTS